MNNIYSYSDIVSEADRLVFIAEDDIEDSPAKAHFMVLRAQALATLALAEQQRLANVIAFASAMSNRDARRYLQEPAMIHWAADSLDPAIRPSFRDGLGLGTFRPDLGDTGPEATPSAPAAGAAASPAAADDRDDVPSDGLPRESFEDAGTGCETPTLLPFDDERGA